MPPKSSSGKEREREEEEEDETVQAVILADSFNKRFKPLTQTKPRCLLPICNATLLDWTFESLALAGVVEIFVIVRSHAELVQAAIQESKWSQPSSGVKVVPIVTAAETFSAGDAMRDIYTHGIIKGDFVLVAGDVVSNVRLDAVVRAHKARRRANKDAVMTMVVKEAGARHRTRARGDDAVFVLDPETKECLHYEPVGGARTRGAAPIPRKVLEEHAEVELRNDLIDCGIDVCSVEVPSLFQDNFDYQDLRRDFVHGVLTSDLLMKNIHCFVLREGYAARVKDTRSYESVSKDILSRWTFPMVPDNNHPGGHAYDHLRGNRYTPKDNTVVLARTCKIGNNTLIGSHTQVYDNANVTASVIGQRCTIGAGARISDSYIFEDTVVGAGAVVERSIVGSGVRIGERSTVEKGCLVGDGVRLGQGAQLRPFERVSVRQEDEDGGSDDESDVEEAETPEDQAKILGPNSNARVWPRGKQRDEDDPEDPETFNNQRLGRLADDLSDLDLSDAGSETASGDDLSESDDQEFGASLSRTSSMTSLEPVTAAALGPLASTGDAEFTSEVKLSLERAFAEGHSVDNAAVELKTLRMASNVPIARVREAVVGAIVDRIRVVEGNAAQQRREIAAVVDRWGELITKIGGVDAVETVSILQMHCASGDRTPLFGQVLAALYQNDIVEEDDIRQWHATSEAKGVGLKPGPVTDNVKRCWAVGGVMIQQFDEQEDSDEESE